MPYAGRTLMQREVTALAAPHWPNSKVKSTGTSIGESHCSVGSWHDNKALVTDLDIDQEVVNVETYEHVRVLDPAKGKIRLSDGSVVNVPTTTLWIVSRDCSLYQINIPARLINSDYEASIRSESLDPAVYEPIAKANVQAAYELWNSPQVRPAGQPQKRLWGPWVAYTQGWPMYPEAYVWHHIVDENGNSKPAGPWVESGRYLFQAIRATVNYQLLITKTMSAPEAVAEAERLAAYWGITRGDITYDERHAVYWKYPPAPTEPPTAEPWGYPVSNDGR